VTAPVSTSADTAARRRSAGGLTTAVLVVLGVAWAVLALPGHTAHGAHRLGHDAAAAALGGWAVMVLAMMMPATLPLVAMLRRLLGRHATAPGLLAVALLGYLAVWTVAGAVFVAGDTGLRRLAGDTDGVAVRIAGGVLVLAGLYQFTALKNACLTACRTPRWFALRYWHGRRPAAEAMTIGTAYGVSCVGCCWALMLVSFVAGAAAMPAMVAMSVLMAAERLTCRGRRLVRPAGALLVALGAAVLTGLLPPVLLHTLLGG
jgi:predicted metal-binding membrane protein